jgi:nucleotide-binding universal stress UspA family protein
MLRSYQRTRLTRFGCLWRVGYGQRGNRARVSETAEKKGIAFEGVFVKDHYPADGIVETAKAKACDLIVIASHGRRGVAKLLMGSQAAKVLAYSPIPVLVCR